MDGQIGQLHPLVGAELAERWVRNLAALGYALKSPVRAALDGCYGETSSMRALSFGRQARKLCLGHSKSFAKRSGAELSPLYLADKASVLFDPTWFYLLRGTLSGEIFEYRDNSPVAESSLVNWLNWYRRKTRVLIATSLP